MGIVRHPKPARLAEKLRIIRTSLGLSQNGMLRHLGLTKDSFRSSISGYELGNREPPLPILLGYAQAAGVCVDVLINDDLNLCGYIPRSLLRKRSRIAFHTPQLAAAKLILPEKLPGVPVHHSVVRALASRRKRNR